VAYIDDLLADGETIQLHAHRHVLFLVLHTALYIAGAIAIWVLAYLAYRWLPRFGEWTMLFLLALSLVPIVIAAYRFLSWRLEQYAVTNYRIIQVEGILNKRTFDSSLEKVNDVLMTQSMFGRMFGFGDIQIITGSDIGVNHLDGISDPFAFKRALMDAKMRSDMDDRSPSRASGSEQDRSTRLLEALRELRESGHITAEEYEQRRQQVLGR
jgi:uncharacterized membrane protein YdbT with pleckstrin-like domain